LSLLRLSFVQAFLHPLQIKMQFIYLATAVLMACGANADAPSAPPAAPPVAPPANAAKGIGAAAPAGKLPTVIAAKCTQAYLPFSEADVAAMSANDTKVATNGNCLSLLVR
jgi:hypothetical protein